MAKTKKELSSILTTLNLLKTEHPIVNDLRYKICKESIDKFQYTVDDELYLQLFDIALEEQNGNHINALFEKVNINEIKESDVIKNSFNLYNKVQLDIEKKWLKHLDLPTSTSYKIIVQNDTVKNGEDYHAQVILRSNTLTEKDCVLIFYNRKVAIKNGTFKIHFRVVGREEGINEKKYPLNIILGNKEYQEEVYYYVIRKKK